MRTVILDGRGGWLRPDDVMVSSISDKAYQMLVDGSVGEESVAAMLRDGDVQPLVGYAGGGSLSTEDLMRVLTCWLPYGTLEEMDGRLVIDTGLEEAAGSGVLRRAPD